MNGPDAPALVQGLAAPPGNTPDEAPQVAEDAPKPANGNRRPVAAYFVARFLEQHNFKDDAIRYYRRCVDAPEIDTLVFKTLAIDRLRVLGVKDPKTVGLDV